MLKHNPKVGVDAIFCMILTTLVSIYQYTLFFQHNMSWIKSSNQSNVGRFYGVTQGNLSYPLLLKPMTLWWTLGFWKRCLESGYLWLGWKISLCFFCMWFVCSLLFLDIFPTQFTWKCFKSFLHMNTHIYKVILVICVEKSSRWNSRWENIRKKSTNILVGSQSKISRFQTYFSKSKKSSKRHGLQ